jgi:hypothetical protein
LVKKIALKENKEIYCLITGLGTILAGFQQGLAKTGPYAYQRFLAINF